MSRGWGWQVEAARLRDARARRLRRIGAWILAIAAGVVVWLAAFIVTAYGLGIWRP